MEVVQRCDADAWEASSFLGAAQPQPGRPCQVYRTIGGQTKAADKYNCLLYFQTLCSDTEAANTFINRWAGGRGSINWRGDKLF